jgi:hypothetical protein
MRRALFVTFAALMLLGCGHPATHDECQVIVQRTAELELHDQGVADAKAIEAKLSAPGSAERLRDATDRCVGTRITDKAMVCVRKASTAAEMDKCLE